MIKKLKSFILKIKNLLLNSLTAKFTFFILIFSLILIILLITLNLNSTLHLLSVIKDNTISNSKSIIDTNFIYTIDVVKNLLNTQYTKNISIHKSNIEKFTFNNVKTLITSLSIQLANAVISFDYGQIIYTFGELFNNPDIVYCVYLNNDKLCDVYKISKFYKTKDVKIDGDKTYYTSKLEGTTFNDPFTEHIYKSNKVEGNVYLDKEYNINIYKIGKIISIDDKIYGAVIIGISLEKMLKEIDKMNEGLQKDIVDEQAKVRLQYENLRETQLQKIRKNINQTIKNFKKDAQNKAILYFIIFTIPGIIIARFFGKSIAKPILSMLPIIKKVSKGILTDKITLNRSDELMLLNTGINNMIDELNRIIVTITGIIKHITRGNENLLTFSNQTSSNFDLIYRNVDEIESGIINNSIDIKESTERLLRFVKTIDEISSNIISLNRNADNTKTAVYKGQEYFTNLISKMHTIEGSFKKTGDLSAKLNDYSIEIKNIIMLIEEISSRTKLLSYNVNIISQQDSDEKNKSISSIAGEVRNLSTDISTYTANIIKINDEIIGLIKNIFTSTKTVLQIIKEGISTSSSVEKIMSDIVNKIDKDTIMIKDISNMTKTITNESKNVFEAFEDINLVTEQITERIVSTSKTITKERDTIKSVNNSVGELKKVAENLKDKMKDFIINEE